MTEIQDPERLDLPSASAMEIVVACPGSVNLKSSIPKSELDKCRTSEDDEWAERGTRIHAAFETGNALELNQEEHDTYKQGLDYLERIKQKWIEDKALDPAKVVEGPRELRVWLYKPYDFPKLLGSCKLDRHFVYRDESRYCLLVCDLKSGWNPNLPPSNHSWQLQFQAVALWKEEYEGATDVRVAYVKAKEKCESGDFCDYSGTHLKYAWDSIVFHSWQSSQPDAPRHAGVHCRWCPCKAYCKEALAWALLPSTMAQTSKSGRKTVVNTDSVSDEDLFRLYRSGSVVRTILDAVTDRLKSWPDEMLSGIGLTHGKGRDIIQWTDPKGAIDFLVQKECWDEKMVWDAVELGITKLAQVAQKEKGVSEDEAKKIVKEDLSRFYSVKAGEPTLKLLK